MRRYPSLLEVWQDGCQGGWNYDGKWSGMDACCSVDGRWFKHLADYTVLSSQTPEYGKFNVCKSI